jgi:phage gpG-like protein
MRMVANRLRAAFRENFREGGRPPWAPLAPSTVWGKKMLGLPETIRTPTGRKPRRLMQREPISGQLQLSASNILIRSGRLRDSVGQSYHPDHVTRIHGWQLEVGTKVPYAVYHQEGTRPYTIHPREAKALRFVGNNGDWVFAKQVHHPGLPARPFLTLTDEDIREIQDAVMDWLLSEGGGE